MGYKVRLQLYHEAGSPPRREGKIDVNLLNSHLIMCDGYTYSLWYVHHNSEGEAVYRYILVPNIADITEELR